MRVLAPALQGDAAHLTDHNGFHPDLHQCFPDAWSDLSYALHSVKTFHAQTLTRSDSFHTLLPHPLLPEIWHTYIADTTAAQFLSLSFSFPVSAPKVSSNAPRSPYTLPFSFHICAAPAQAS